jgi:hypothetical protein
VVVAAVGAGVVGAGVELGDGEAEPEAEAEAEGVVRAARLAEAEGLDADCAAQPTVNPPTRRINTAIMRVVVKRFINLGYISVGDINMLGRARGGTLSTGHDRPTGRGGCRRA